MTSMPTMLFAQAETSLQEGFLDWKGNWCLYRIVIFLAFSFVLFLIFNTKFPMAVRNDKKSYPSHIFVNYLSLFFLIEVFLFVLVFAFIGQELVFKPKANTSIFPSSWKAANANWLWIAILLLGTGLFGLMRFLLKMYYNGKRSKYKF